MQIMIKETSSHEPKIINGVIAINDNPRSRSYYFKGVNNEGKPFCYWYPYEMIEYFRKVGD